MDSFLARTSQNTFFRIIQLKKKEKTFKFVTKNQKKKGKKLSFFAKKQKRQNFQFFIKNRGLTLQEKCQIFDFLKSRFFWFKMDSFLARTSQNTFSRTIQLKKRKKRSNFRPKIRKKKEKSFLIFDQKSWTKPTKKCQLLDFLNRYFKEGLSGQISIYKVTKCHLLWPILLKKKEKDKVSNFSSKPIALPLLKNNNFLLF